MGKEKVALIIGNGPSVDQLDPGLLDQFTSYGANHIYKKFPAWKRETDNVVITDSLRLREVGRAYENFQGGLYIGDERCVVPHQAKIRSIVGRDFVPLKQLKKETLQKLTLLDHVVWSKHFFSTIFQKQHLSFDLNRGLNFGFSVAIAAIQLAAMRGFKTILLTGVDSSYSAGKMYFGGANGTPNINPDFTKNPRIFMEPTLALAQVYLEELGVTLVDCTPEGKLRLVSKGQFTSQEPFFEVTRPV